MAEGEDLAGGQGASGASALLTLRRTVRVAEPAVEVRGQMYFGPPKTKAGRRSVPLPRQVADELATHLQQLVGRANDEVVSPGPSGGVLRAGAWRRRVWSPAIIDAALAPLRPHDHRHTAVSLWAAAGASPNEVAMRAGHTSVSVVLDRYRHLFPAELERTTARLEAMFAPLVETPTAPAGRTAAIGGASPRQARPELADAADVVHRTYPQTTLRCIPPLTCTLAVGDEGFDPPTSAV